MEPIRTTSQNDVGATQKLVIMVVLSSKNYVSKGGVSDPSSGTNNDMFRYDIYMYIYIYTGQMCAMMVY
jgi:hypothetical protein